MCTNFSFINAFRIFWNLSGQVFCSGNYKLRCIWDCCSVTICTWDAIKGKTWLGSSVSLIFSVCMWAWPHVLLWSGIRKRSDTDQISVDLPSRSSMPKEIWASLILTFHVGKGLSSGFLPKINWGPTGFFWKLFSLTWLLQGGKCPFAAPHM